MFSPEGYAVQGLLRFLFTLFILFVMLCSMYVIAATKELRLVPDNVCLILTASLSSTLWCSHEDGTYLSTKFTSPNLRGSVLPTLELLIFVLLLLPHVSVPVYLSCFRSSFILCCNEY